MNKYRKIGDFHGSRRLGVGSSDIPVLAGLYKNYGSTPLTLWQEKTGRAERDAENNRTYWGRRLEGIVLREFVARRYGDEAADKLFSGHRAGRSSGPFKVLTEAFHPDYPFALAHCDMLADGAQLGGEGADGEALEIEAPYIVEAKTAGLYSAKRREGRIFAGYDPDDMTAQGIPDAVFLQVQWQLFCYGVESAYVAVLIDTANYREYGPIMADARVQEKCLALASRFWRLVEADTPPAPETWDDVQKLFPDQKDTTAMVSGDIEIKARTMIERKKIIAQRIKDEEEELDDIKNAIGVLLGENSTLAAANGDILARSTEQSRESLSIAALRKEAPTVEADLRARGLISKAEFRVVRF